MLKTNEWKITLRDVRDDRDIRKLIRTTFPSDNIHVNKAITILSSRFWKILLLNINSDWYAYLFMSSDLANLTRYHSQTYPIAQSIILTKSDSTSPISETISWADGEIFNYNRDIFIDPIFSADILKNINNKISHGSKYEKKTALLYVRSFAEQLEDKIVNGTAAERRKAIKDLELFLGNNPIYRTALPDRLNMIADELEAEGVIDVIKYPEISATLPPPGPLKNPDKAKDLVKRCQQLWEIYYNRPTKKNLRAVFKHLETMKRSRSESVKSERSRCLRAANKEAKKLKLKP